MERIGCMRKRKILRTKKSKEKELAESKWAEKINETAQQISDELQNDFNDIDLNASENDPVDESSLSTRPDREFEISEWETKIGQHC